MVQVTATIRYDNASHTIAQGDDVLNTTTTPAGGESYYNRRPMAQYLGIEQWESFRGDIAL